MYFDVFFVFFLLQQPRQDVTDQYQGVGQAHYTQIPDDVMPCEII